MNLFKVCLVAKIGAGRGDGVEITVTESKILGRGGVRGMNVEGTEERLEVADEGLVGVEASRDGTVEMDRVRRRDLVVEVGGLGRKEGMFGGGGDVRSMIVGD